MQIILSDNKQEALFEIKQLLSLASKALDPMDNQHSVELNNSEAVALMLFLDAIGAAAVSGLSNGVK